MKEDDLIKRLENLETPDVELSGHRQALRTALLNSNRFQRRTAMGWARILAPVAAAVALIAVFGFLNIIQPEFHTARAIEIARADAQVQTLMADYGLGIAEVQLQDGEAFVLLSSQLIRSHPEGMVEDTELAGAAYSKSAASRAVDRLFGWMLPCSVDEQEFTLIPEMSRYPDTEESLPGYVLRVDLPGQKVSGFLEITDAAALRDIDFQDAQFTESAPPRQTPEEEPESH